LFLLDETATAADVANCSQIVNAPEGQLSLQFYPEVRTWLERVEALPGNVHVYRTAVVLL